MHKQNLKIFDTTPHKLWQNLWSQCYRSLPLEKNPKQTNKQTKNPPTPNKQKKPKTKQKTRKQTNKNPQKPTKQKNPKPKESPNKTPNHQLQKNLQNLPLS